MRRIWKGHGLQPHRVRTFKLSNDPKFADKLKEVVGLYVDPPAHAVVLSLDEKSQIQALDRIQPGLPMKKGRCATMTHDYKRHGTTTLLAALDILEGTVIGRCICQPHPARLKRGVFTSIVELQTAINSFIAEANGKPKPFVWTNPLTPSSPLSSTGQILDCANARLSTQAM